MKPINKKGIGLKYALRGILNGCTQRNFLIHLLFAVMVVVASFIASISAIEWCIILLCIAGVLSMELINSAIENIVDQVSPEYSIFAKQTKDISAGAVLIVATISAIIGLVILLPKFIQLYYDFNS